MKKIVTIALGLFTSFQFLVVVPVYAYRICLEVRTGEHEYAGTDSPVYYYTTINTDIEGDKGYAIELNDDPYYNDLERNQTDRYEIDQFDGNLLGIQVSNFWTYDNDAWQLESFKVYKVSDEEDCKDGPDPGVGAYIHGMNDSDGPNSIWIDDGGLQDEWLSFCGWKPERESHTLDGANANDSCKEIESNGEDKPPICYKSGKKVSCSYQ